ncbi:hypothetical protein ACH4PU_15995 [Streptomyces sp. NPDC021100]|uniref:hypothetical protein n=1 Tax=Streptomyces sp. NPDC021100 TaxID=3365114 RepID=UPI0037B80475
MTTETARSAATGRSLRLGAVALGVVAPLLVLPGAPPARAQQAAGKAVFTTPGDHRGSARRE